jgi:uncharacterized membrane protein
VGRWSGMTAVLTCMVLVVVIALVVISVFAEEDDDAAEHVSRADPDEVHLEDLLDR